MDKDNNKKLCDYGKVNKDKVKDNTISSIIIEFEMKDELYEIKKIISQALEAMVEKLVLDQVKNKRNGNETWKILLIRIVSKAYILRRDWKMRISEMRS